MPALCAIRGGMTYLSKRYHNGASGTVLCKSIGGCSFSRALCTIRGGISHSLKRYHNSSANNGDHKKIRIRWKIRDGSVKETLCNVGSNILRAAQSHNVELEGACEGVCACSTCHVIFEDNVFDTLNEPSEDEDDMLDQAFALTTTSRLGCQIVLTEKMDNILIELPKATRNFYVDGHVPQPH